MSQGQKISRVQSEIDSNLKRAFDDVANEEIPDKFADLLAQLRAKEAQSKSSPQEGDDDTN